MISQEDYAIITEYDHGDSASRERIIKEKRGQLAKTFLSLLEHVSKDQTIQYVLVMIDDMLQVCDSLAIRTIYITLFGRGKKPRFLGQV